MDNNSVNISHLSKAEVLRRLYNASHPLGMGYLHFTPEDMTLEEAEDIIENMDSKKLYFDYLNGRVMKVNITGDSVDPWGYDRDHGEGALEKLIEDSVDDL